MEYDLTALEDEPLAEYAMRNGEENDRLYDEPPSPYRTVFQRDRDRIIHSKAFRRLGYKTQVFVNTAGDNYRTRLTHSIEVSQVSRSVAAALRLNRDYAETIALAHDLGHTPFGHAGQDSLHRLMQKQGGFEHNRQSLRIISVLESRYLDFPGLNLSRGTLKGIMKHSTAYECDTHLKGMLVERSRENPCLEARLVDLCDRITYIHHDLEDGLDAEILSLEELLTVPAWKEAFHEMENKSGVQFRAARNQVRIRAVIRFLMNRCIVQLISGISGNLELLKPSSLQDVYDMDRNDYPVRLPEELSEVLKSFQKLLHSRLYRNPRVMQMSRRGIRIVEFLFNEYSTLPQMMPGHFQERIESQGLSRVVADYVSGMTDRFATREYHYLMGEK